MAVDISTLLPQLPRQTSGQPPVQVKLETPLPANLGSSGAAVAVKVVALKPDGTATLQLPTGATLQAQLNPPVPVGTQLNVPIPSQPNQVLVQARAILTSNTPAPVPAGTPQTAPTASAGATASPLPNQPVPLAVSQPILSATQLIAGTAVPTPTAPQPALPNGPVAVQVTNPLPASITQQPLPVVTATITRPPTPQGAQAATIANPAQPQVPVAVNISSGQALPVQTQLTLALPPNTPQPTHALVVASQTPATGQSSLTNQPAATPTKPFTPPLLAAVKVLLPSAPPAAPLSTQARPVPTPVPQPTTTTARVMVPPPSQPLSPGQPISQPVLLANGQQAVVQSPQGLPSGSVIALADIQPLSQVASVVKVEVQGQTTGQPQTSAQQQAAAQPLTARPVSPPPNVPLQGTITAQDPHAGTATLTLTTQPYAGQTLTLKPSQPLPLDTALTVTLKPDAQGQVQASIVAIQLPPAFQQQSALTHLSQQWPTLSQALNILSAQNPAAAAQVSQHLPHVAALAPTLLPYMEALQRNDPARAFGKEATQILKALGVDFAPDFQQLQALAQPNPEGWRGVLFPYIENPQDNPQQGGFFWRRSRREDDPEAPASTRFIVQLHLSELGDLQLDGLLNGPELWLKLRRKTITEPGFVQQLQQLVTTTLESLGLTGGIAIETTQVFEVDPIANLLATTHNTLATEA